MCGATPYWTVESRPGTTVIGIAVGNFVDPTFTAPMREYHTELRHPWVSAVPPPSSLRGFPTKKTVTEASDPAQRRAVNRCAARPDASTEQDAHSQSSWAADARAGCRASRTRPRTSPSKRSGHPRGAVRPSRMLRHVIGVGSGVFADASVLGVRGSGAYVLLTCTAVGVSALVSSGTVIAR